MSDGRLKALLAELAEKEAVGAVSIAPAAHGLVGQRRVSAKALAAIGFLLQLVNLCGDACPVTGDLHVFMFKCPLTLYGMFVEECLSTGVGEYLSQRGFYMLFEKGSAAHEMICHVRWKRQVTQKLCSMCGGLALERSEMVARRVSQESPEFVSWLARKKAHITLIGTERRLYHELRSGVRLGKVTGVTLFIMDAGKPLRHPRRAFDSDLARSIPQISGAFIGLINHSTPCATLFLSPAPGVLVEHRARAATAKQKGRVAGSTFTWESTDVNCSLLLAAILNDYHAGRLKKHLHLQVDGGSDARGFVVVMVLGVLCALGVIERATIASLIPGHTHEDIDQLFSVLSKALKSRAGEQVHRSWTEIWNCALRVYPGWDSLTTKKPGPTGVSDIRFVWKLKEAFGQGPECTYRPCLSPGLAGLFGTGKDHATKPSRFEIGLNDGVPVVSAFLSSVADAPQFSKFGKLPIFRFCPRLDHLETHDLQIGWNLRHAALIAALEKVDHFGAGYTKQQVADMRALRCNFVAPPADVIFFGIDTQLVVAWQKLCALGHAPIRERGRRGAAGGERPAKRQSRRAGGAGGGGDGEDEEEGLVYVEEGDSESDEPGDQDTDEEAEGDGSVVDPEAPVYTIEAWLDRRWNEDDQEMEYLLKYEGYDEAEWTLARRINGAIPPREDERFDQRDEAAAVLERRERKVRAFRAAAQIARGDLEDDERAPGPAAVVEPAQDGARAHLRRNATKKKL